MQERQYPIYSVGVATKKQMSQIRLSARSPNEWHLSKPPDERFQQDHQTNSISIFNIQ